VLLLHHLLQVCHAYLLSLQPRNAFYCPQTLLTLGFHCTMDVSDL